MRWAAASFAVACCLAAAGGITYLHGFERALGHDDWRFRPALIHAYFGEVVFRAGPCALLAAAAGLAAGLRVRPFGLAVLAVFGSALAAVGTYETIREYIRTPPGGLMPTTAWDGVALGLWLAGAAAVPAVAFVGMRRRPGPPRQS